MIVPTTQKLRPSPSLPRSTSLVLIYPHTYVDSSPHSQKFLLLSINPRYFSLSLSRYSRPVPQTLSSPHGIFSSALNRTTQNEIDDIISISYTSYDNDDHNGHARWHQLKHDDESPVSWCYLQTLFHIIRHASPPRASISQTHWVTKTVTFCFNCKHNDPLWSPALKNKYNNDEHPSSCLSFFLSLSLLLRILHRLLTCSKVGRQRRRRITT